MGRNATYILLGIKFKRLQEFLKVASVPIEEAFREQILLFYFFLLSKINIVNALEVAAVLGVYFFFN
jgi:hypothetical protein